MTGQQTTSNEQRITTNGQPKIKNRFQFLVLSCSLFVASSLLFAQATGYLADQAQLAWQDRDKPGQTEQAIHLWTLAVQAEPGRGELWISLTKACGRALRHAKTPSERIRWADLARKYGQEAITRAPQSSEAYASDAEALGQWANTHKGLHSLSLVKQAVDMLKQSIALDSKNAYSHMLLASFYREAPSVISVGDKSKALAEAKLGVACGPNYAINHLVLAKVYLDLGKKMEAIAELQTLLTLPPPADAIPETRADQETAITMLRQLGSAPHTLSACGQAGGACSESKQP